MHLEIDRGVDGNGPRRAVGQQPFAVGVAGKADFFQQFRRLLYVIFPPANAEEVDQGRFIGRQIGGLTSGGGIGYLVRKHGLTIDSVLAAEVVTARGDIVVADRDHHPDLFWAVRGGGGNFGVVTRWKYQLHALPAFTGIAPGYPLYAAREQVKLEQKDDRVTKATVTEPIEGPPVRVTFKYDAQGRATRIDEDHGADGKIDRRFDYRYDDVGNVTGMTLTETDFSGGGKGKKRKKTAKLAYGCWAPKGE